MKIHSIIGLLLLGILVGPIAALAQTIDDTPGGASTYIGGAVPTGYYYYGWDVIGDQTLAASEAAYGVDAMTVTFSGNMMTVKLTGPFFTSPNAGRADGSGLFISDSGWQVADKSGSSPYGLYPNDVFGIYNPSGTPTAGEGWDYVVDIKSTLGPGGYVYTPGAYNLDWATINWSTGCNGNLGRCEQAWGGGDGTTKYSDAQITRDSSGMTYTILDDSFLAGKTIGLHWTMDCGNDVVEGQVTVPPNVPEPSAIILLAFGLAGLGIYRRMWLERSM